MAIFYNPSFRRMPESRPFRPHNKPGSGESLPSNALVGGWNDGVVGRVFTLTIASLLATCVAVSALG